MWLAFYLFLQLVLPAPQVLEREVGGGWASQARPLLLWFSLQVSEAEPGSFHGFFRDSYSWGSPQSLSYKGMGVASLVSEDWAVNACQPYIWVSSSSTTVSPFGQLLRRP